MVVVPHAADTISNRILGEEDSDMQDVAEASEELLWTMGLAVVAAVLLFAVVAATSWAATMLGACVGSF
jgi:CHASE3 domain sensor protein